jgi:hypothetical protein
MDQFLNLTPKQALFCDEFFKDFNATKAALRAGYSAETALSGYLMTLPKIKCHLQQRGAEAAEKAQVTHAMLLAELKVVGFARMSHFFGSDGKPKAMQDVDEDTKAALLNYTVTEDKQGTTTIKIRMNNKLSALDKLAKHLKFYNAEYPAHSAMYYVVSNPVMEEHDRFEEGGGQKSDVGSQMTEVLSQEVVDKRVAEAVAAAGERMKAEFELKLKKVKKKARKKLKNTEEYQRAVEEREAGCEKQEEESGSCSGEWQGEVGSRRFDLDVQRSDFGSRDGENTEEYRRGEEPEAGSEKREVSGAKLEVGSVRQDEGGQKEEDGGQNCENTDKYPSMAGQVQGKQARKYPLYGVIYE